MSLPTIPTAAEIKARIVSDLNTSLNQNTPALPKAFNNVLAGALAGLILLLYQAITWTYRQIFPDTADITSLRLLGSLVDVEQLPASFAVLEATVPGTEGQTASSGTLFRGSNDLVYKIQESVIISGGVATVSLKCQTSGENGNLPNGSTLDIISPDPALIGTATITATTTSGDDAESDDSFRSRISASYKKRKTGGSPVDYEAWGLETPNFDWVNPLDSATLPGEIVVYGKVDNQTDGIPTQNQLDELLDYLLRNPDTGLRDRHPIGAYPTTLPISRKLFDVIINIQDGTPEIKTDVETAVTDYLETKNPYNIAISLTRNDTISNGGIADAGNDVANPAGASIISAQLVDVDTGNTIQSYTLFGGEWGKINSITFVDIT